MILLRFFILMFLSVFLSGCITHSREPTQFVSTQASENLNDTACMQPTNKTSNTLHATAIKFDKKLNKGTVQPLAQVDNLTFTTHTSSPISSREKVILRVTVKQGDKLFRKLEPVKAAYAHLEGYNADRTELIQALPIGEEARSSNQRGGPNLKFGVKFPEPGYYRLFLQVRVDEKDIFVPIDVNVL